MEIWRDIRGYEGSYQVSNLGRVRSLDRTEIDACGRVVIYRGKVLRGTPNSSGYLRVELKGARRERWFVHRLVALYFVENPKPTEYTVVNHIDNNFHNNNASNLEWTTQYGNMHHAIKQNRMVRTKEWKQHLRETNEKNGVSVEGTNIITGEHIYFVCLNDCAREGFQPSCVSNCCNGKRKTHKGYTWRKIERWG